MNRTANTAAREDALLVVFGWAHDYAKARFHGDMTRADQWLGSVFARRQLQAVEAAIERREAKPC